VLAVETSRRNYSWGGMFSAIACKTAVDTTDDLKKPEAKQYSITINDGSIDAKANPNPAAAGQIVSLSEGTKAGFVFNGWDVNKPETGLTVSGRTFSMPEADVEVTTKWLAAITVTFDYLYEDKPDTVQIGQGRTLDEQKQEREGYVLVGWFTDKDFTTKYNFETPVTQTLTLYAKWEAAWTVTFNYNYDSKVVK